MNKKQRIRNRNTASELIRKVQAQQPCPECGEPVQGGHWMSMRPVTLEDEVRAHHSGVPLNPDDFGFWTCAKFYEPDTFDAQGERIPGRRLPQFINPRFTADGAMAQAAAALLGLGALERLDETQLNDSVREQLLEVIKLGSPASSTTASTADPVFQAALDKFSALLFTSNPSSEGAGVHEVLATEHQDQQAAAEYQNLWLAEIPRAQG